MRNHAEVKKYIRIYIILEPLTKPNHWAWEENQNQIRRKTMWLTKWRPYRLCRYTNFELTEFHQLVSLIYGWLNQWTELKRGSSLLPAHENKFWIFRYEIRLKSSICSIRYLGLKNDKMMLSSILQNLTTWSSNLQS